MTKYVGSADPCIGLYWNNINIVNLDKATSAPPGPTIRASALKLVALSHRLSILVSDRYYDIVWLAVSGCAIVFSDIAVTIIKAPNFLDKDDYRTVTKSNN